MRVQVERVGSHGSILADTPSRGKHEACVLTVVRIVAVFEEDE